MSFRKRIQRDAPSNYRPAAVLETPPIEAYTQAARFLPAIDYTLCRSAAGYDETGQIRGGYRLDFEISSPDKPVIGSIPNINEKFGMLAAQALQILTDKKIQCLLFKNKSPVQINKDRGFSIIMDLASVLEDSIKANGFDSRKQAESIADELEEKMKLRRQQHNASVVLSSP